MNKQDSGSAAPAKIARWSLFVLVAINILNFYDRHVAGALVEPVRREFSLSDTQIGWINTGFTILYGVVGLPLGALADRVSRKKLLAVGIVVWSALTACAQWVYTYPLLVITRLGVGVGEASCAPAATSWIGDLYPSERRSKPLALFMLGVPIGGALSFFFSGLLAQRFGWRMAMVFAAVPALLLIPMLLMLREPVRGASEPNKPSAGSGSIFQVLSIPTFWWIALSGALVNFNLYAIGTFLPAFFGRIHRMNVAQAGITVGVVYAIGGICGGTLLAIALPLLTLTYGLLNMYYGLVYASIQDIVAPALRGTSMAIYFVVMYLLGASWGTVIIGKMSDNFARHAAALAGSAKVTEVFRATGLQQAMLAIPVLSAALALVLWAGSRTIGRDIERQRARTSEAVAAN